MKTPIIWTAQHSTAQHSTAQHSTAVKTGLISRLLDYNITEKDICIISTNGVRTNVLFCYNGWFHHIGGDAYG